MDSATTNTRLTAAVHRLWTDERFLAAFRRDPEATLRRYRLTDEEVAAVKAGDEFRLAALGADVRSLHTPPVTAGTLAGTLFRVAPRLAALLLAAQLALATPALTAARGRSRGRSRARARTARVFRGRSRARARAGWRVGRARAVRVRSVGVGQERAAGVPIDYGSAA